MINYLKNTEIDKNLWDTCIRNSGVMKPYAYSWYLDIMAPGWEALVDDEYDSVFPVPGFRKYGIKYVATPIFLQQLGVYSPDKSAERKANEFFFYMPDFYRFIDLCIGQNLYMDEYRTTERTNFILSLSASYEKIYNSFSDHCKRNIQKAENEGISYSTDITPRELINLFMANRGREIRGIRERDYNRVEALMNHCRINRKGRIIGVRSSGGRLVFGIFIIELPGFKTLLFVVNTEESRNRRINYHFVNELVRENAGSGIIIDFAGSSIPSIASFMESFGSSRQPFYRVYRNSLPWPLKMFK